MATHKYSAAAAPSENDRAPVAHRFEDRFDSASRFDSSQTPPPFDFKPSFPAEPHSDVSAQVLQLEAEIRQLQLELRALEQSKSDSRVRSSASPTPAMSMPTLLEKFVAGQTDSSLPTFSGAATEWPVFYQIFTTSTDACALSDGENLARLNKRLKGKARELVQSLLVIPQNVPSIIRTLPMRYGRPDIIVRSLIKKGTSPPIRRQQEPNRFCCGRAEFGDNYCHRKCSRSHAQRQVMSDLVSRLPSSLRLQWGEQVTQDPNRITLADFSTWPSAKAEALSYVISETADSPPRPTAEALLATPQARPSQQHCSRQPPKCAFCSHQHWSNECKKYTTVTTRQAQLMAQNRCFKCLRPGHSSRHCRSQPKDCFCCKARGHHHQSLCPQKYGVNPAPETRRLGEQATAVTEPSPPPPVLTLTEPANLAAGKETVCMQSATAQVSNPSTTRASIAARILFDTGSYRTYITAELADKLQQKPTLEETLSISTFGSNNIKKLTASTADITVHFVNGMRHHRQQCNDTTYNLLLSFWCKNFASTIFAGGSL